METNSLRKINLNNFETSPELAEIKVSYKCKQKSRVKITTSLEAFNILYPLYDKDTIELQEQFFLLLLNRMNAVLGWIKLSVGGASSTIVDPRIVFSIALQSNACGLILSHCHPSGTLLPSKSDIALTQNMVNSGKLLEILLLDHIIVSPDEKYYSFADEGNM